MTKNPSRIMRHPVVVFEQTYNCLESSGGGR
jgi:hypothetical protein